MKSWNKLLSLLMALVMLAGLAAICSTGPAALAEGELTGEIPEVGLQVSLPAEGPTGAEPGMAVDAELSVSAGSGFSIASARWYTLSNDTPTEFQAGQSYYARIIVKPEEGFQFTEAVTVEVQPMGVENWQLQEDGTLNIRTRNVTVSPTELLYNLWLGNTRVTSLNCADILGDGSAQYDPETKTLTLNKPAIPAPHEATGALILAEELDLTVTGSASLKQEDAEIGIYLMTGGSLKLKDADLTAEGKSRGILVDKGSLTVEDSALKAVSGTKTALELGGDLSISGDKSSVSGKSSTGECGVSATGKISVNAGTLEGTGSENGILAQGGITLAETHGVVIPADGKLSDDGKTVCDQAGETAKHAMLAPKDASFTVSFDTYGGPEVESQTVPSGGTAEKPADPSLSGFLFRGWYVNPAADEEPYDFSTPVTADLELKAFWGASIQASVMDTEGNEGVGGTVSMGDDTYDTALSAIVWRDSPSQFYVAARNHPNFVFDHWEDGAGNPLTETETSFYYSAKDGSRHFVAVFRRTSCTVTFDTAGGSEVPSQTVPYGGKATEPDEDPIRKGYSFDCWCSDKDGKEVFDFNTPITGDITLYARWTAKAKYTVVSGGGTIYGRASGKEVQIIVKRNPKDGECFKHFTGVKIDGAELKKDTDYTAEAGSTIVNLKPGYLGKLNTGRHVITIVFDDGEATTGMTVKAGKSGSSKGGSKGEKSPETGDTGALLWGGTLCFSCIGLGGVLLTGRKARRAGR